MKRLAGTITLILAGSLMLASGESFARGGHGGGGSHGGGHAGAFHGGGGHAGTFRGGGHVGSFRGSAPLIAPAVRGFRTVPTVRSFHGHSHFVVGVRGPFFGYPYAYAAPYYYSYPPAYAAAPYVQPGVWYYCPAYQAYYPQVQACPGGWQAVVP